GIDLVERARVQELAPADLGAVNIGGVEDLHRSLPAEVFAPTSAFARATLRGEQRARAAGRGPGAILSEPLPPAACTTAPGRPPSPAPSTSCSWAWCPPPLEGPRPGPPGRTGGRRERGWRPRSPDAPRSGRGSTPRA